MILSPHKRLPKRSSASTMRVIMATYSEAAKKRMAKIPKKILSKRMREIAIIGQAKFTKAEKRERALRMVEARKAKQNV